MGVQNAVISTFLFLFEQVKTVFYNISEERVRNELPRWCGGLTLVRPFFCGIFLAGDCISE